MVRLAPLSYIQSQDFHLLSLWVYLIHGKKIPKWDYSTYGTFVSLPFKKSRNLTRKYSVMYLCCLQENYRIHGKSTHRQLPQRLCWDRSVGTMRRHTCPSPVSVSVTLQSKREGQGFPGGAVVGSLPANAADTGSRPGPGGSHMLRSN